MSKSDTAFLKEKILANAKEINRLLKEARLLSFSRKESEEANKKWIEAGRVFRKQYGILSFQFEELETLKKIDSGDAELIELALCFMEVRPYFFRSQYIMTKLKRRLKRAPLTSEQKERWKCVLERMDTQRFGKEAFNA